MGCRISGHSRTSATASSSRTSLVDALPAASMAGTASRAQPTRDQPWCHGDLASEVVPPRTGWASRGRGPLPIGQRRVRELPKAAMGERY